MELVEIDVVHFDVADYAKHAAPRFLRLSSVLEATWVIYQKTNGLDISGYDMILVGGFEWLWPVRKYAGSIPTLIFLDSTPVAACSLVATERPSFKAQCRKAYYLFNTRKCMAPHFVSSRRAFL
jgi:hypothetical protein